jgi:endoglucanase
LVTAVGALAILAPPVRGAGEEWTPEKVAEATRLNTLVFFREEVRRGHPEGEARDLMGGSAVRGTVTGLENASQNLPSKEAAKDGELGVRLDLTIEGADPAWALEMTPELVPPYGSTSRPRSFFDAWGYRPQGTIEFDLRGDARRKGLGVSFRCTYGEGTTSPRRTPLDPYLKETTDWQHVVVPVADLDWEVKGARLVTANRLMLTGEGYAGKLRIDLDNVVLQSDGPEPERGPVRVDHVGYLPSSPKIAFVCGSRLFDLSGRPFSVRKVGADDEPAGEPVLRGELTLQSPFEPTIYGEWIYAADFTPLQAQGRYVVEVPGVGRSVAFFVDEGTYDYLFYHLARFFMYQRSGTGLSEKNAFEWARPPCYTDPVPLASDESNKRPVRHGWVDAGDSRMFPHTDRLVPMLLAWEMSKEKHFDGQLNLPESGNGVPDFLDEARWQGEYYRDMQLEDGRCMGYLLTGRRGGGSPIQGSSTGWANDKDPRYIRDDRFSYGTHVEICGCMAMMGRALKAFDQEGAAAFQASALRAWDWAEANRPDQQQGQRRDPRGERLWAAVELWRLTRQERFHQVVRELADTDGNWVDSGFHGAAHWAWLSYVLDPEADPALREQFRTRFVDGMAQVFELVKTEPYAVSVCPHGWHTNPAGAGTVGMQLAMAWKLSGRDDFRRLAEEHVHYVLGRNPYRLCIASNIAPESFSDIYHGYEWVPGREVWMPGFVGHMSAWGSHTMSRFDVRHVRPTRITWDYGEPCVGFNYGITAAVMLLMEGKRYDGLISQGAFPGTKPVRPGLPFPPTSVEGPWGAEPVVPGPAQ